MIDIHCHILPGIDDGANSWASSVRMCQQSISDGVKHIIATPHANFAYAFNRESHQQLLEELRTRVPQLEFSMGCDFHLSIENVEDALINRERYVINGTRYLLVEFGDYITSFNYNGPVLQLLEADFIPIVTHPERNPLFLRSPALVREMAASGCKVQLTANALTGFWGSNSRKVALELLKSGLVHYIASDAHDWRRRTTVISEGLKVAARAIGEANAMKLVLDNPQEIFN